MKPSFEMEVKREIWSNEDGYCFEVGPDRDGLGLVEVRLREKDGTLGDRISFSSEAAFLVGKAILDCAKELQP